MVSDNPLTIQTELKHSFHIRFPNKLHPDACLWHHEVVSYNRLLLALFNPHNVIFPGTTPEAAWTRQSKLIAMKRSCEPDQSFLGIFSVPRRIRVWTDHVDICVWNDIRSTRRHLTSIPRLRRKFFFCQCVTTLHRHISALSLAVEPCTYMHHIRPMMA